MFKHKDTRSNLDKWENLWQGKKNKPVVHQKLTETILKTMDVKDKKILEIGSGLGGDIAYLAEKGANCTAVDISQTSLKRITKLAKTKSITVKTTFCDAKDLIFKDESFDIVFHQGFLEHFKNPILLLEEQKRVLKKRGYILIDVPQKYNLYTLYKRWKKIKKQWDIPWETEFTKKELVNIIEKSGFIPQKIYYRTIFPPGIKKIIEGKFPTRIKRLAFINKGLLRKFLQFVGLKIEQSRLKSLYYQNIGIVAQKPK